MALAHRRTPAHEAVNSGSTGRKLHTALRLMERFRSETDFWRTATLNEKLKRIIFIRLIISYRMDIILYF